MFQDTRPAELGADGASDAWAEFRVTDRSERLRLLNDAADGETVRTLLRTVPAAVPGIVFLSGGQSPEQATAHLNALNKLGTFPWQLSFSYGRALQEHSLQAWAGDANKVPAAQALYLKRARLNGAARSGSYTCSME